MQAPIRKCCGQRHWESEWECPNKDESEQSRKDFTVTQREPKAPVEKKEKKKPGRKPKSKEPFVFDPELDLPGSKATHKSQMQMRSRRRSPESIQHHRDYMRQYMIGYRARKAAERKAAKEAKEAKEKSID